MRKVIVILALALLGATMLGTWRGGQNAGNRVAGISGALGAAELSGKIVYAKGGAIWVYANGRETKLTRGPEDAADKQDRMPSLSPDGTEVAYIRFDEGFSDLYKLNINNPGNPEALTDYRPNAETGAIDPTGRGLGYAEQALWALYPAWSPDGTELAWTHDRGIEYPGLFRINADGSNPVRLSMLDHSLQAIERVSWSPDGTQIAATNYVGTEPYNTGQIWVLTLDTGRWLDYTKVKDGAYDPAWSPDGKWIAFAQREGTSLNIYVMRADPNTWEGNGTQPTLYQLTTDGASRSPAWSPDGTQLAYIALEDSTFDIYTSDFNLTAGGTPSIDNIQRLTDNADVDAPSGLSWGP